MRTFPRAFPDRCPLPHLEAPGGPLVQPPDSDQIIGIAASPTDAWLVAVWSHDHIHVSRDGGSSWSRVLDGEARVLDVSFDCHGSVLALRAEVGLGVRNGARERWQPIPRLGWGAAYEANPGDPRYVPQLVGGGRLIAVVGAPSSRSRQTIAAFTEDGGTTWWHSELGWSEGEPPAAAWHGDDLHVAIAAHTCGEKSRHVVVGEQGTRSEELDLDLAALALHTGAVHGLGRDCNAGDTPPTYVWKDGTGWRGTPLAGRTDALLVDGPRDLVLVGRDFHTLAPGRVGPSRPWSEDATLHTTDLAGRIWGLRRGEVIRR